MKKLILLCVVALSSLNAFSQVWDNSMPDKTVTYGVRVGVNGATMVDSENYFEYTMAFKWHAGISAIYNFSKSFAIESGLIFTNKGANTDESGDKAHINIGYVQVPALALLRLYTRENTHVQLKAGPHIGFNAIDDNYFSFSFIDAGLSAGVGIGYKKYYVGVQYDFGLPNVHIGNYSGNAMRNRCISLSVGYDF